MFVLPFSDFEPLPLYSRPIHSLALSTSLLALINFCGQISTVYQIFFNH